MYARKSGRTRPGDRSPDNPRHYAHELHELADALTRDDRKLSRLSEMAARHGVALGLRGTCATIACEVRRITACAKRLLVARR